MKPREAKATQAHASSTARFQPGDLEIVQFERGGLEFAVLAFRMPRLDLPARLSPAEQEVARLLCEGRSPSMIARRRQRSRFTVVNQVRSIYSKLGVTCHAELLHALTVG